ncbi:MAG: hypothetical protein LKE29_11480 [Acidaminococcaceae bacterium]|jgi:hypothetical protein|nr:hypothetical protein [Acidaminococcaceae bacterium]
MKKTIKQFLMVCFQISMPLFMILGTLLVGTQLFAIFTQNGNMAVYINKLLRPWACYAAGVCLFAAFLDSYIKIDN